MHILALRAKVSRDFSLSLITTIHGVGICWRCRRISLCTRRRSSALNEEYFMLSSRIFNVERL